MKRSFLWLGVLALFVAALWIGWGFRSGNSGQMDLDLIWLQLSGVEVWRVLLVTLGLGAFLGSLIFGFAWLYARLLNRRYRRAIQRLEAELHQMRSLPLAGGDVDELASDPVLVAAEQD